MYVQSSKWALLAETASPLHSRSGNLLSNCVCSTVATNNKKKKLKKIFPCYCSFKIDLLNKVTRALLYISVPEISWYPGIFHGLALTHEMRKVSSAT